MNPFFQVGVNEGGSAALGPSTHFYYAFWSSTKLGFHPRMLFEVNAGDAVLVSMVLNNQRWVISATDEQSGMSRTFSVLSDSPFGFNQASWQQEDVTNLNTSQPGAYVDLTPPRFSRLRINLEVPRAGSLQASWMSSDLGTFAPTPFRADGFAIKPLKPSAEDLHFQRIAVVDDFQVSAFDANLARWSSTTSASIIKKVCVNFGRALQQNIASLRAFRWSRSISKPVAQLIAATEQLREAVTQLGSRGAPALPQFRNLFRQNRVHSIALRIRAGLRIPATNLSGIAVTKYIHTHPDQ